MTGRITRLVKRALDVVLEFWDAKPTRAKKRPAVGRRCPSAPVFVVGRSVR
jgi:hypothetical protein